MSSVVKRSASMMRNIWVVLALLAAAAAGCTPQGHIGVIDQLPPPLIASPPRVERPSPAPRELPPPPKSLEHTRVVVDPGHGGKDPGAPAKFGGQPEKHIVLDIGNELARQLRERGVRVTTTRTTDRFIELDDRALTAERTKTDLLVSVHADSAPNSSASGTELFIARAASADSRRAAEAIQAAFNRAGIKCRGIKQRDFRVVAKHSRPAVLVECGFLTNREDAARLNQAAHRQRVAAVIAQGVIDYLSH